MKVLVTGANGFLGSNLVDHLRRRVGIEVETFVRGDGPDELRRKVAGTDLVFHLAGVNRTPDKQDFTSGNLELTQLLCDAVAANGRPIPIVYSSSVQAAIDNDYGRSKAQAEEALLSFGRILGSPIHIGRLPNLFGKWSRPNYNSVVATFCHNISRDLPIRIDDPSFEIRLAYVDDVVETLTGFLDAPAGESGYFEVGPVYSITIGALADTLKAFRDNRTTHQIAAVGTGLTRALYATYISYYPPSLFSYPLKTYADPRGVFSEVLKTRDSGQFSFFTAGVGITRGGHYHHTKNEKFLVLRGEALFRFRHVVTDEFYELRTSGQTPIVVETVPGWAHDVTNVGDEEMIVMLWANEVFDPSKPDTFAFQVSKP